MKSTLIGLGAVVTWALADVASRVALSKNPEINPAVFTCAVQIGAAIALLILAGPGRLGMTTLRQGHTWLFGFISVFVVMTFVFSLTLVTATEANALARLSIPLSVAVAWAFLGRRPQPFDVIGLGLIGAGLYFIFAGLDKSQHVAAISLVLCAIGVMARTVIAELHPASNDAENLRERYRVTGVVLLVSSVCYALIFTLIVQALPERGANQSAFFLPTRADLTHGPTLLWGFVIGGLFYSAVNFFYLYASILLKTERVMMFFALFPIMTGCIEYLAALAGYLDMEGLSITDGISIVGIAAGAFLMIWVRNPDKILTR